MTNPLLTPDDYATLADIDRQIEQTTAPDSRGERQWWLLVTHFGQRGPDVVNACVEALQLMWSFDHCELPELIGG